MVLLKRAMAGKSGRVGMSVSQRARQGQFVVHRSRTPLCNARLGVERVRQFERHSLTCFSQRVKQQACYVDLTHDKGLHGGVSQNDTTTLI